ncbi:MAG: ComF family protein [Nocardioidaceae bacterium]
MARSGISGASLDLLLGGACVGCAAPGPSLCPSCRRSLGGRPRRVIPSPCPPRLPATFAVSAYDGVARSAVVVHKEEGWLPLARPLGAALSLSVLAVLARSQDADVRELVLVPVPSSRQSVRARGHDPLLRISRACAAAIRHEGVPTRVSTALRVRRPVADQTGLTAPERQRNLAGAFGCRPAVRRLVDTPVVIIDDIITTGATLGEAARVLSGASVRVLGAGVIAATQRRGAVSPLG